MSPHQTLEGITSTNYKNTWKTYTAAAWKAQGAQAKNAFSMTPDNYRKRGDKGLFLNKTQFTTAYLQHISQNIALEPEMITQGKKYFVRLQTCFYSVDSKKTLLPNNCHRSGTPL